MIGVDWGTSSFRAWRFGPDGAVQGRVRAARGILQVPPGGFAAALGEEVGAWLAEGERLILLAGMVGSRQGWVEAPYVPCPAGPGEIAAALVPVPFAGADCRLVPGLSDRDADGVPEVMRGEETQILGALAETGEEALICLPGSHAKWARVAGGRIAGFSSFMTGEVFAALKGGTILGRMMDEGAEDEAAFAQGLARAGEGGGLLHHLFGVRTLGLTAGLTGAAAASYLSGLLIGHEIAAAMPRVGAVFVIGAPALAGRYGRAIALAGGTPHLIGEEAGASGLAAMARRIGWI